MGSSEDALPHSTTKRRPSRASRQFDYTVAIVLNGVILFVVNVWPTWHAAPFVTDDAAPAVAIINVAALAAIALNALCLLIDRTWMNPLTEFVNAAFGLVLSIEVWRTFPFNFPEGSFDWELPARFVIIAAIAGSIIGMIVQFVLVIVRALRTSDP